MQLLTRESDYAVRALFYIARAEDGQATAAEIAQAERVPYLFLRRVMQKLGHAGFLESHKGRAGGFSLARSPAGISLLDVITTFQGKVAVSDCLVRGEPCCNQTTCVVRRKLKVIERVLRRELSDITIALLVRLQTQQGGRRGIIRRNDES
jgi:Rrf2 family protein